MFFSDVYNRVIVYWPEEVLLSDAEPVGADGFYFPGLSTAWDGAKNAKGADDHWADLMVWTMFQVFHCESKRLYHASVGSIRPGDVDLRLIEEKYVSNLSGEGWEQELAAFQRG